MTLRLSQCGGAAVRAWWAATDTFLIDCDGVLWRGNEGVAGVASALQRMRADGKRVYFVTNNSTKSRVEYVHKLQKTAGITATVDEVVSSAYAAAAYLRARGLTRKAYVVGQSGLVDELQAVGIEVHGPADFDKVSPRVPVDGARVHGTKRWGLAFSGCGHAAI